MSYREEIGKVFDRQEKKGLETYGKKLEDNRSLRDLKEISENAQEEMVDALMYIQHLITMIPKWETIQEDIPASGLTDEWREKNLPDYGREVAIRFYNGDTKVCKLMPIGSGVVFVNSTEVIQVRKGLKWIYIPMP